MWNKRLARPGEKLNKSQFLRTVLADGLQAAEVMVGTK